MPQLHVVHSKQSSTPSPVVLEINRLGKQFESNGSGRTPVLTDVSFTARRGEMICILGRSGCGKSTLLNILAGFMLPSSGTVRLNGRPVNRPGPDRCVVFQDDALFPWLTVRENIAFGLKRRGLGRRQIRAEVDRFLSLVDLADFGDFLPHEISGGMKQRVSIARVLILQPEVLLMDEPFAALDAQTREEMQNLLLTLWDTFKHTIIFVTHDVGEAVLMADRILFFGKNPGGIRADIPIDLPRPREKDNDRYFSCYRETLAIIDRLS